MGKKKKKAGNRDAGSSDAEKGKGRKGVNGNAGGKNGEKKKRKVAKVC